MDRDATHRAAYANLAGGDLLDAGDADDRLAAGAARDHRQRHRDVSICRGSEPDRCQQLCRISSAGELLGAVEPAPPRPAVLAGQVQDGVAVLSELDAGIHPTAETRGG